MTDPAKLTAAQKGTLIEALTGHTVHSWLARISRVGCSVATPEVMVALADAYLMGAEDATKFLQNKSAILLKYGGKQ